MRSADEDPLRSVHRVRVLMDDEVTSADTVQVARYSGSLLELVNRHFALVLVKVKEVSDAMFIKHTSTIKHLEPLLDRVADRRPILRTGDCQRHLRLEAWLVEHRKHVVTVEHFKLSVQVLFVVAGVHI